VPIYIRTYIHRVGRTARAGRPGTAVTLVRHKEVRHFRDILRKAEGSNVQPFPLEQDILKPLVPHYTVCHRFSFALSWIVLSNTID
jgi:ATP-dependent RNA helicase DDX51/DBP6